MNSHEYMYLLASCARPNRGKAYYDQGATFTESQRDKNVTLCMVSYFFGTITLAYPLMFAVTRTQAMQLPETVSDEDMDEWSRSEDAMPYRRIAVNDGSKGSLTKRTVQMVAQRLVWITHITLDKCTKIEITTMELSKELQCLASLRALSLALCGAGVTGE